MHGMQYARILRSRFLFFVKFGCIDVAILDIVSLRERLRAHKVFTKDQCFYLNYHKFSIKSFVLDVY